MCRINVGRDCRTTKRPKPSFNGYRSCSYRFILCGQMTKAEVNREQGVGLMCVRPSATRLCFRHQEVIDT